MSTKMRHSVLLGLAGLAAGQNFSQSIAPTVTVDGTAISNPTLLTTSVPMNVEDMWDLLVGPVSTAATTTTVEPTPVPSVSLIPPPPIYYSPFPSGQQNPLQMKNESWSFPKDFLWGVAGAAFQIEGAVKAGGRGPSIWDVFSHRVTNYIYQNGTADVVDNNYYLYKQDIARIAAMGVKAYSLTISWSRIMPFGRGAINHEGLAHYNDVINECLKYNITPFVTLYHWDTPLALENLYGGWLSEDIVADFEAYAKVVFNAFGDRVKYWYTVNEPSVFCSYYPTPVGYFKQFDIPDKQQSFYCSQNVILAHATAYHVGKKIMPNAMISYKNNGGLKIPLTNSSGDAEAVQRAWDFNEGLFSDPIFLTGDYNSAVKSHVSKFLRPFTASEQSMIKDSADFYAHDAYTSQFYYAPVGGVAACLNNPKNTLWPTCANTSYTYAPSSGGWLIGAAADPEASWLHKATDWVPKFLHYLQDTWAKDKMVMISEFGFSEPFEAQKMLLQDILFDPIRTSYFQDYMKGVLMAMSEGVKVMGSCAWGIYDDFEWGSGYGPKFGLQYVNFSDPALPRYYKASFFEFKNAFDLYQEK